MKPRDLDPMRPSTPPPATSWWTKREVQQDRAKFDAEAEQRARERDAAEALKTHLHQKVNR